MEQQGDGANRKWVEHAIDESWSQSHAMTLADIDGDGVPELITGKRYRGHNGHDAGSYDPLVIYYYKINRKTGEFSRYPISVNGTAGAGTQFIVADLDGDGDLDIASAGKTGVHFFENLAIDRFATAGKLGVHVLENLRIDTVSKAVREETQPLNRDWPFPGEGRTVEQEEEPKQ